MSRIQLAVYAAIGVCLLLLGVRAVSSAGSEGQGGADGGVRLAAQPVGGAGADAAPASGEVVVHVAGEVADPGVFRLPAGSRVTDAVEKAGGVTGAGDPDAINLAARLADGQQIVVPGRVPAAAAASASEDGPISLGSADQADLETIDGIGPVTAADIIEFRDQQGGIASIEELDEVPGIGPATIDALSERLQP